MTIIWKLYTIIMDNYIFILNSDIIFIFNYENLIMDILLSNYWVVCYTFH